MVDGKVTLLDFFKHNIATRLEGTYTCACKKTWVWKIEMPDGAPPPEAYVAGYLCRIRDEINACIRGHE